MTPDKTLTELKNEVTAKQVIQAFIDGKTLTQYAREKDISRNTVYSRLDKTEAQEVMLHEVRQLETRVLEEIEKLLNSISATDRRTGTQELAKLVKHVQDKLYPSLLRTETVNVNIDLTQLKQQQQLHEETLSRLPQTTYDTYWRTYNQVKTEWGLNQTT